VIWQAHGSLTCKTTRRMTLFHVLHAHSFASLGFESCSDSSVALETCTIALRTTGNKNIGLLSTVLSTLAISISRPVFSCASNDFGFPSSSYRAFTFQPPSSFLQVWQQSHAVIQYLRMLGTSALTCADGSLPSLPA
jgi:hypothetical protein